MKTRSELNKLIEACPEFILYKHEIIKSIRLLASGIKFKLPTANTDWCLDLFKVITYLCNTYKHTFFITSDEGDEVGFIHLYIRP